MKTFIMALALLLSTLAIAGETTEWKLDHTEMSPLGDIIVEHYYNYEAEDIMANRQVWLVKRNNPDGRHLLYKHGRSADVLFSPNEVWLVINDFLGSNVSDVRVFKREGDLQYAEVNTAKLYENASSLFTKERGLNRPLRFGHAYWEVIRWASDSSSFLLGLDGSLENIVTNDLIFFKPWKCVVHMPSLDVSSFVDSIEGPDSRRLPGAPKKENSRN